MYFFPNDSLFPRDFQEGSSVVLPRVNRFSMGILYIAIFFAIQLGAAQEAIEGTLPQWQFGVADVITGFQEPRKIGSVNPEGNFTIPLLPDFLQKRKKEIDQNRPISSMDKTSPFIDLDRLFRRRGGSITLEDAIQPVGTLSNIGVYGVGNLEGQDLYGVMMAASSEGFAEAVMNMTAMQFTPGFIIDWYYVERAASIKGVTSEETMAVSQSETFTNTMEYNMEFQPGWNMVKYEVLSVFQDSTGRTYPMEERYTSLTSFPENFDFIFIPR